MNSRFGHALKTGVAIAAIVAQLGAAPAQAFCGFYVAQADARLFNKSSKVVLARDGETTAITMSSDYEGDVKEFAVVVPVPTFIERKQIGVVDPKTIDHLDRYTAPRLVEYRDEDPCELRRAVLASAAQPTPAPQNSRALSVAKDYGVTIEASYDVEEYDVLILSAKESGGLIRWLTDNKYRIPKGASEVIGSYIKQNMRFFVAKVNVDRMTSAPAGVLRPLQVRYQSAKFMVPLRLGTVNANGPQDLIIYALGKDGRVESSNYRTVKIPSDIDVPLYVKDEFGSFYKAVFARAHARENNSAVFVEYAWDMGWCDPCAAEPVNDKELVDLGARWLSAPSGSGTSTDQQIIASLTRRGSGAGQKAYVTRLHVRYDARTFPEDIALLETKDRSNFQGRYVQRQPWQGTASCPAAETYRKGLPARFAAEATNLENITGWTRKEIAARMSQSGQPLAAP